MSRKEEIRISVKQTCPVCKRRGRIMTHTAGDIQCNKCKGAGLIPVRLPVHQSSLEQTLTTALKLARADLTVARLAYEAAPVNLEVARLLAQAVRAEQAAEQAYMAAMTAGLAAQIEGIVLDAFQE